MTDTHTGYGVPQLDGVRTDGQGALIHFSDVAEDWLRWKRETEGRKQRTIDEYRSHINQYIEWFINHGDKHGPGSAVRPSIEQLEAFVRRPRRKQGAGSNGKPATRRADIVALRGVFRWGLARGRFTTDPTLDLIAPRVADKEAAPIPKDDWLQLHHRLHRVGNLRLFAAVGLGYVCGLRSFEVWNLRAEQLLGPKLVRVHRKGDPDDHKGHTIPWAQMLDIYRVAMPDLYPLADEWAEAIRWVGLHPTNGDRMFRGEPQQFKRMTDRHWKALGLPQYRVHSLRDSCASNLVNEAGLDLDLVRQLMNHKSIQTTLGYISTTNKLDDWLRRRQ